MSTGSEERTHLTLIVLKMGDGHMSRIQYLREQAARAERFSRMAFDSLTTERLKQAAKDYLRQAEQLAAGQ